MSKKNIIPIFVPHNGCPNDCVFCNQTKITGQGKEINLGEIKDTIYEYLSYFKDKSDVELAFYGGSFTAIDFNLQNSLLDIAREYKNKGLIKEIRMSTRPDAIDENILLNLKKYLVDTIELGVQSLDSGVLKLSNRGHNVDCVYTSSNLIKEYGFNLGLQQMIGLPGDNIEKSIFTAEEFIKLNPHCVRIYPTLVIKDTKLEDDYYKGLYDSLSIDDAVNNIKEVLKLYIKNDINVIRVGLQPTEEINYDGSIVSGPFHPAFRQLVESEIIMDVIKKYFNNKKIDTEIIIKSSGKNISNIAGQKGRNKSELQKKLGQNIKLKQGEFDNFTLEFLYNDIDEKINIKNYF